MRMRVTSIVAVVAFVVAIGAAVLVYSQRTAVPTAGQTPGYSEPPLPSATPLTSTITLGSEGPSGSTAPSATALKTVFLGDDYTAGTGATQPSKSWTALVSDSLHLSPTAIGVDGAGYAKHSPDGKTYADLVDQAAATQPDLVIVSGGRNDIADDADTLRTAAKKLFKDLRDQLPDATIVALAPWWGDSPHPPELKPVDKAVRDGVEAIDGVYLNPGDPLHGHPEWMKDDAVPNNQGYRAIADTDAPAIKPHLPN